MWTGSSPYELRKLSCVKVPAVRQILGGRPASPHGKGRCRLADQNSLLVTKSEKLAAEGVKQAPQVIYTSLLKPLQILFQKLLVQPRLFSVAKPPQLQGLFIPVYLLA